MRARWNKIYHIGFCSGVPVNKEITIVLSLFRSHWLAVYCLVFCISSCVPVHEDRTPFCQLVTRDISQWCLSKTKITRFYLSAFLSDIFILQFWFFGHWRGNAARSILNPDKVNCCTWKVWDRQHQIVNWTKPRSMEFARSSYLYLLYKFLRSWFVIALHIIFTWSTKHQADPRVIINTTSYLPLGPVVKMPRLQHCVIHLMSPGLRLLHHYCLRAHGVFFSS